jgi:hypothetical protein
VKPFPPQNGFCRDGGHLAGGRSYYVRNETAKMAAIIMISRPFIINRHSKAAPGTSYRYTLHSPASCARSRRNFGSDGRSQPRALPPYTQIACQKSARRKSTSLSTVRPTKPKLVTASPASHSAPSYEVYEVRFTPTLQIHDKAVGILPSLRLFLFELSVRWWGGGA